MVGTSLLSSLRAPGYQLTRDTAVLNDLNVEWEDVLSEDVRQGFLSLGSRGLIIPQFNPVSLALALLDTSSAGRDFQSFVDTKLSLERALKGSVDRREKDNLASLF